MKGKVEESVCGVHEWDLCDHQHIWELLVPEAKREDIFKYLLFPFFPTIPGILVFLRFLSWVFILILYMQGDL